MDNKIIEAISSSIVDVIGTMTMTTITMGSTFKHDAKVFYDGVVAIIGLAGENANGSLLLNIDDPTVLYFLENMLGQKFPEVDNEVLDAVGEITNILCGDLKRKLTEVGYLIGMATPLIVHGRTIQIRERINREMYVIPCSTPGGSFAVETNLIKI